MNKKNSWAFDILIGTVVRLGLEREALLWLYLRQINKEAEGSGNIASEELMALVLKVVKGDVVTQTVEKMSGIFFDWSTKGDRVFLLSPYRVLDRLSEENRGAKK